MGPGGTGKSTLIRDGLLPHHPPERVKVYDLLEPDRLHRFESLTASLGIEEAFWLSRDPASFDIGAVKCREWRTGLRELMRV